VVVPDTHVNTEVVTITIGGASFQPGCAVSLGAVPLAVTSCTSDTILAQVPADLPIGALPAGFYDVTVTNPDSQWGTLFNGYTASNPFPVITSVEPALAVLGSAPSLVIGGADFRDVGAPGTLEARLNGTPLMNVAYLDANTITADVPPGMALGAYVATVVNPGPTGPSGSLVNAFTVFAYTDVVTCSGGVSNCSDAGGPPDGDGNVARISCGSAITLYFDVGISDGAGYDMVFYEYPYSPGILLDWITLELSDNGIDWYRVFDWDGDSPPGDVAGTNVDGYANDPSNPPYAGEADNEPISSQDLYPALPSLPNTGIAIDIGVAAAAIQPPQPPLPSGPFRWVRVSAPTGCGDDAEVDAILRLH
jgi:hypothetical protein